MKGGFIFRASSTWCESRKYGFAELRKLRKHVPEAAEQKEKLHGFM